MSPRVTPAGKGVLVIARHLPVGTEQVDDAINHIRRKLLATGDREVPSRQVGEWVMEELRQLDQVAYVRFASVYRKFEDVNAFREEIERLETELPPDVKRHQLDLLDGGKED